MDEFIGFGVRDLAVEYHWRELERPAVLKTAVPKILIFPGDGTETAEQANGFCKAVSQVFGKQMHRKFIRFTTKTTLLVRHTGCIRRPESISLMTHAIL